MGTHMLENILHGFGVYRFANGHRYEGAWHEGRRQGCGMYAFRNGGTQSGYWDNGVLTISTSQDTSQEARRIAEKAVAVADMDERVNRAVTAANRAANAASVAAVKAVQNRMHDRPLEIFPDSHVFIRENSVSLEEWTCKEVVPPGTTIRLGYRNVLIEEQMASFFLLATNKYMFICDMYYY
nr:MORN motif-containing protein [Tanacetum cinerariifolium]